MARPLVAVEIDLLDVFTDEVHTLYLCNEGPFSGVDGSNVITYQPRLLSPVDSGLSISAENYGQTARSAPNAGAVNIAMDPELWPYLNYRWTGREYRIYVGEVGNTYTDVVTIAGPVEVGKVTGMSYTTSRNPSITVTTAGAVALLDGPLLTELYTEDDGVPDTLLGKPKPRLWGAGVQIEPVLEDAANQVYRVSTTALGDVSAVRVGGIDWPRDETVSPAPGTYSRQLGAGTFTLSSDPLSGQVRCDAESSDAGSMTAAELIRQIVTESGGDADIADFSADATFLIGYYAKDPVNRLDVLDEITLGVGAWWGPTNDGKIKATVYEEPDTVASQTLTDFVVEDFSMKQTLIAAWRIRVEYARNWQPNTQFYDAVPLVDQQAMTVGGKVTLPYENLGLHASDPTSLDVPLIRSLVLTEADANEIRDRLAVAWGAERRLYEVVARGVTVALYDTVEVDYLMIGPQNFRVHSVLRTLDGDSTRLLLWGEGNVTLAPDLGYIITETGSPIGLEDESGGLLLEDAA